jgi:hypothetical protein
MLTNCMPASSLKPLRSRLHPSCTRHSTSHGRDFNGAERDGVSSGVVTQELVPGGGPPSFPEPIADDCSRNSGNRCDVGAEVLWAEARDDCNNWHQDDG